MAKLIVLRGNSGSGKSSVAKRIREVSTRKIAYVEQDNIRRGILKEKETDDGANITLISQIVEFALARDYDVILEGILNFPRYGKILRELAEKCPENYFYYFDISLEETLRRHETKWNSDQFGEKEMKQWYKHHDLTKFKGEKIIPEEYSLEQTVQKIIEDVGL
jgi:adenylate kinase family enzyme